MEAERFFSKVSPEPNSGCWLWTGAISRHGYGSIAVRRTSWPAHRYSWALHRGDPDGLCVCHSCDVRLCVNPDHLFLGTVADNNADMLAKGRHPGSVGERNSRAKLTSIDVLAIRADPRSQRTLAAVYAVGPSTIAMVRSGRNWAHLRSTAE